MIDLSWSVCCKSNMAAWVGWGGGCWPNFWCWVQICLKRKVDRWKGGDCWPNFWCWSQIYLKSKVGGWGDWTNFWCWFQIWPEPKVKGTQHQRRDHLEPQLRRGGGGPCSNFNHIYPHVYVQLWRSGTFCWQKPNVNVDSTLWWIKK